MNNKFKILAERLEKLSAWMGYQVENPNEQRPEKTFTDFLTDWLKKNARYVSYGANLSKFDDDDPILKGALETIISSMVSELELHRKDFGEKYSDKKKGEFKSLLLDIDPLSKKKSKKPITIKTKYLNLMNLIHQTINAGEGETSELHPAVHVTESPRREDNAAPAGQHNPKSRIIYPGNPPVSDQGRASK